VKEPPYKKANSPGMGRSMVAGKEPLVTKDYEFLKVIGTGSFGKVYLAKLRKQGIQNKSEDELFAIKVLKKSNIVDK